MKHSMFTACVGLALLFAGCKDDEQSKPAPAAPPASPTAHSAGEANEHIPVGEASLNGMKLVVTAHAPVKQGGEAAFEVVITGAKPKVVRGWVGDESGRDSLKAKGEEESDNAWHVHTEVPDPLPPNSKFWVEVEPPTGEPSKTSFDLKVQ